MYRRFFVNHILTISPVFVRLFAVLMEVWIVGIQVLEEKGQAW